MTHWVSCGLAIPRIVPSINPTLLVHSFCIHMELVRLKKELIPVTKAMVMIIANKIDNSVENEEELGWISPKPRYHPGRGGLPYGRGGLPYGRGVSVYRQG